MKMAKSDADRLSELPQSLIFLILSFMEMRDVVKTSLLSKRWKDLWVTIPYLYFDEASTNGSLINRPTSPAESRTTVNRRPRIPFEALDLDNWASRTESRIHNRPRTTVQSRNFINRALMLWQGSQILKFKINLVQEPGLPLSADLDLWLRFAMKWDVQELELNRLHSEYGYRRSYENPPAPQRLYSCSSIARLKLSDYNLVIREEVQWNQLKSLTICVSSFIQDSIDQVVNGSPQLETFEFQTCQRHDDLRIQSSSLKRVSICSTVYDSSSDATLTVCTPKLEALAIRGAPHSKCLLTNALSLSSVNLDFTLTDSRATNDIPQCEELKLPPGGFKIMLGGVMEGKTLNAKMLRVRAAPFELVVSLVEIFPNLETLAIDLSQSPPPAFELGEASIIIPMAFYMQQLRTVEITWYKYEASMFQVMEFLLKNAVMLAKMVIKNGKMVSTEDMLVVARKLLNLQRSFQSVNLVLYENSLTSRQGKFW